jgi:N-acetylmuramoyl-L-alanine amidase
MVITNRLKTNQFVQSPRVSGLLLSLFSILLFCSPAAAAKLEEWGFDLNRKRIQITTSGAVQPRAQLIANPNRLAIDLPGITLGYSSVNRLIREAGIESIRVGQFDPQTTRLVIELSPGYTLNPNQVQFQGDSDRDWTVSLPDPIYIGGNPHISNISRNVNRTPSNFGQYPQNQTIPLQSPDNNSGSQNAIEVNKVETTADGFFIPTSGGIPSVQMQVSGNGNFVSLELLGASLADELRSPGWQGVNRHGVKRLIFTETEGRQPVTRISFRVDDSDDDWQAMPTNGGIMVLVHGHSVSSSYGRENQLATIEAIDLTSNGYQLLVRSNRPFTYTTDWERSSGAYQIRIPAARLANGLQTPNTQRTAMGWLSIQQVQQNNTQTVLLQVQPAAGMRIGRVNQPASQLLSVAVEPSNQSQTVSSTNPNRWTVTPRRPQRTWNPSLSNNSQRNARMVVVIDPGHGGRDPGALGINGLREKDIVMSISQQVAANLNQFGIQAVLTRQNDREIDLEPRVQLAERVNGTVFVSIHANSVDLSRPEVNGVETYYYSTGRGLARSIHNHLQDIAPFSTRPDRPTGT